MVDSKTWAVLTGDIVASSKLSPVRLKAVMQRLRDGAERFQDAYPNSIHGKLDVFSGDGWQMLMPDRQLSLRAAIYMRACVRSEEGEKSDSRVAIAWGEVDAGNLNPDKLSESTGEAFTASGRALEGMRKPERMAISPGNDRSPDYRRLLIVSIHLLDEIVSRWKPGQAQSVALALLDNTQLRISKDLDISQSAVSQALHPAGWAAVERFVSELEYKLKD